MKREGHFLFLGSGGSMGIPVIGCACPICRSKVVQNQRLRSSGLLTLDNKKILIDCGPDFRLQALTHRLKHLDGLILTHTHYDHVAGIDELRAYYMREKKPLHCLLSEATLAELKQRYYYLFDTQNKTGNIKAHFSFHLLEGKYGETAFLNIPIQHVTYEQSGMAVNGFRIGNFAYLSDIRHYEPEIFRWLVGVEILVISALRMTPSPFHLSVNEAVEFANRVGARETWLTHIAHDLDYQATNDYLPPHVRMAYDTLGIHFSWG
jgi:phosphoribosyl 1,2-cyclic phosphate phosphodiesterase